MPTCPRCERANPDGFRFCGACGAELPIGHEREVRKTVTALFADVTGSTALGERLDPEALRRVMSRYFDEMRTAIELHGGTVEKFIGDAVMAVFGVPRLHEDDALRAVRAASEMMTRLTSLNAELDAEFGIRLQARIGLNTGDVVTGDAAPGERYATGDAVNVAARLEQAAEPGEVLLGDTTWRLTRRAIEAEPVAPMEVRGKAEPVMAHRLLALVEPAEFGRRLDAPLVGRQRELNVLRAVLDEAILGRQCMLVTLLGPPGIGKSRMARELLLAAEARADATVLTGQCLPYGEGITYWPLREIFAGLGAEDELDAILGQGTPEEIAWSVRKSLEHHARERPLVLIVEDVHWAEPILLDLVEHLVDWTRDSPVLLVCLSRLDLLDQRPAWAAGRQNARSLVLSPLSREQADQLITSLQRGAALETETVARVHEVAEGNPLFVEQLLAMLAEGEGGVEGVPPTMQALLATRLDALPNGERELIEGASVIGLEFDWDALGAISPAGRRPPGVQLAALVRKELVRPHEAVEDAFRFRHILIRDAAYERIPKEVRSDLHERLAGWLDTRPDALPEMVGYHLEQALRYLTELGRSTDRTRPLAERAADRLSTAGRRAEGRGDARAAANLLGRAAALLTADAPDRVALLPAMGAALRDIGEMERAEAVLVEAVERGRATGQVGAAAAAGIALVDLRLHRDPDKSLGQTAARRATREAIATFEEIGDRAGLALALGHRGKLRFWAGESAEAIHDLARAVDLAREAGGAVQEAESVRYLMAALYRGSTTVVDAVARVKELDARNLGNRRVEISSLAIRAVLTAMLGEVGVARRLIGQAQSLASRDGILVFGSGAASAAGEVELIAGDFEGVERELRPVCDELERIGERGYLSSVTPLITDAVLRQGRIEEALALSERWQSDLLTVAEDADAHVGWFRVRGKILARTGEAAEGERLCRRGVELAEATDFLVAQARALADLGDVIRLAGRPAEATSVIAEAIRRHEQKGNVMEAGTLRRVLEPPHMPPGS
ncbi:MAG: adenylate/guanylate cyclase domain-containing protein [Candidatus Limnocylindria bacterium]